MAKCPICSARKAKRKCLITDAGVICSLCCGQTRRQSTCSECPYWQPPRVRHDYAAVPAYTTAEMDASPRLQDYAMTIEVAIAELDRQSGHSLKDDVPIRVYERLLDRYHFEEPSEAAEDEWVRRGLERVDAAVGAELRGVERTTLVKVLAVLRFVARRRTRGRREYLSVVQTFVGTIVSARP